MKEAVSEKILDQIYEILLRELRQRGISAKFTCRVEGNATDRPVLTAESEEFQTYPVLFKSITAYGTSSIQIEKNAEGSYHDRYRTLLRIRARTKTFSGGLNEVELFAIEFCWLKGSDTTRAIIIL